MTTLPTAAHPTEIQHWPPACPTAPPITQDLCIPHFLGGGARICFMPGLPMPWLSCGGTQSPSPPFPAYSCPYNISTTTGTSPPPFPTSGNPVGGSSSPSLSLLPWKQHRCLSAHIHHATDILMTMMTLRPAVWTHRVPIPSMSTPPVPTGNIYTHTAHMLLKALVWCLKLIMKVHRQATGSWKGKVFLSLSGL